MSVFAWVDEADQIVISKDSQAGEPCLCIPTDRDAIWMWIAALIYAADNGELDKDLPGDMKRIAGPEEPLQP